MSSVISTADLADAGRLLAFCARPKERPARDVDYQRLVGRYMEEADFASTCDAVAAGAGLELIVDEVSGVIAVASSDSAFRMPLTQFMVRTNQAGSRALAGLVVLCVAKVAYPQPHHLDDPLRVARVSVAGVTEYLERQVQECVANAEDLDADRPEDRELWRAWDALRRGRAAAVRASAKDRAGLVRKVCRFLEDEALLHKVSDEEDGTWRVTPRMRLVARSIVEDSDIFSQLHHAADGKDADESDAGGSLDAAELAGLAGATSDNAGGSR